MTRALLVGCIAGAILSIFPACGKAPVPCDGESLMPDPHACPDRASLGFAQEFGTGTLIGTAPQESLAIRNGSVADLKIDDVTFSGDSAFTVTAEPMTPATIKGNKYMYLRVVFAPTQAKQYTGTITMKSNAVNYDGGVLQFPVSGCGIPADGGASPCYRDGGTP
jgi:hypothetical protein